MAQQLITPEVYAVADKEAAMAKTETEPKALDQYQLKTILWNFTDKSLYVKEKEFWSGSPLTEFRQLPPRTGMTTAQQGLIPHGVKYGIMYLDGPDDHTTTRKFIVAFDGLAKKAYAETGVTGPVDWNVVEVKLRDHGEFKYEDTYAPLGCKVVATFSSVGNGVAYFEKM